MTFKEILDLTKNRVDETDPDAQIDLIIKEGINHSYIYDLSKLDPRLSTAYVPVANGMATLPDDLNNIVKISPSLIPGESRVGNAILSDRDVTFTITYTVVPEPMALDNDEPDLNQKFHYMLSTAGCIEYFAFKKKTNLVEMYNGLYEKEKASLTTSDAIEESVLDVYEEGE